MMSELCPINELKELICQSNVNDDYAIDKMWNCYEKVKGRPWKRRTKKKAIKDLKEIIYW